MLQKCRIVSVSGLKIHQIGADLCCFCGKLNPTGIFVRHDGKELRCEGKCE